MHFANRLDGRAVGTMILGTTDGGRTWVAQPAHRSTALRAVKFVSAQTGRAVGDGGTIFIHRRRRAGLDGAAPPQGTANALLPGVDARSARATGSS